MTTEPQPVDLTAFLANAEYAILQAQGSTEGASEYLISAGTYYGPKLLAAVENMMALAHPGPIYVSDEEVHDWTLDPAAVRQAISRALLGEGESGG